MMIDVVYVASLNEPVDGRRRVRTRLAGHAHELLEIGQGGIIERIGECVCGDTVMLESDVSECDNCGLTYNCFGQELRPQSEWSDYEIEMGLDN